MNAPPGAVAPAKTAPLHLVVMGVSGCGKTSIGRALAQALALQFI